MVNNCPVNGSPSPVISFTASRAAKQAKVPETAPNTPNPQRSQAGFSGKIQDKQGVFPGITVVEAAMSGMEAYLTTVITGGLPRNNCG